MRVDTLLSFFSDYCSIALSHPVVNTDFRIFSYLSPAATAEGAALGFLAAACAVSGDMDVSGFAFTVVVKVQFCALQSTPIFVQPQPVELDIVPLTALLEALAARFHGAFGFASRLRGYLLGTELVLVVNTGHSGTT